jgi:hypothetical protein
MKDESNGAIGVQERDPWTTDPHFKGIFWSIVVECLVQFHGLDSLSARREADSLRGRIESPPPGISGELIYHDEPFYVACDIAGDHESDSKNQKITEYRNIYETIVNQVRSQCDLARSARVNSLGDVQSG